MSLLKKIDDDLKVALKDGNKLKLAVLRLLKSEIKYKQIELGRDLTDDDIIGIINSSAKKRRDSIEQFDKGGRKDLVDQETAELSIVFGYLPQQLSEAEIKELIIESIKTTGAASPQQMGLVMKDLSPKIKGKADGRLVSRLVTELLSNS